MVRSNADVATGMGEPVGSFPYLADHAGMKLPKAIVAGHGDVLSPDLAGRPAHRGEDVGAFRIIEIVLGCHPLQLYSLHLIQILLHLLFIELALESLKVS